MICYLCKSKYFKVRQGAVRDNPALQIIECYDCSLVTLNSFDHVQVGHYENSGMHGDDPRSVEAWLRETDQDDQRRFTMLKSALVNQRLLDFGCGAAGFLYKSQSLAAEVSGIELERRVHEFWKGDLNIFHTLDEVIGKYDLITAFHVVEHLLDPRLILRQLASHLEPSGRLVIEVPSSNDALLTLYDSNEFQKFTYWSQHLFLFNAETLLRLAKQSGLRILSIKQFQRYPLSNHLYWLSKRKPGGHQCWSFLDSPALIEAYSASLAALGRCDTLIAHLEVDPDYH
jgi:2-polyprenyl-3-methyl-5-hydroxy-6-metoxy-1,4-benzoquinol methylase